MTARNRRLAHQKREGRNLFLIGLILAALALAAIVWLIKLMRPGRFGDLARPTTMLQRAVTARKPARRL